MSFSKPIIDTELKKPEDETNHIKKKLFIKEASDAHAQERMTTIAIQLPAKMIAQTDRLAAEFSLAEGKRISRAEIIRRSLNIFFAKNQKIE